MEDQTKKPVITKDTLLPMSLVLLICGGVVWMNNTLIGIDYKLNTIEAQLTNKFTRVEMENWALRLKLENPEINIPEVTN